MASTKSTEAPEVEVTTKQVINEGIDTLMSALDIPGQHNRYKAMRAIAFEAFAQAIEAGTFDGIVKAAIKNADDLPSGWELERTATEKPAKKATPAKAAPKAAPAKATPATRPARKRPTR